MAYGLRKHALPSCERPFVVMPEVRCVAGFLIRILGRQMFHHNGVLACFTFLSCTICYRRPQALTTVIITVPGPRRGMLDAPCVIVLLFDTAVGYGGVCKQFDPTQ